MVVGEEKRKQNNSAIFSNNKKSIVNRSPLIKMDSANCSENTSRSNTSDSAYGSLKSPIVSFASYSKSQANNLNAKESRKEDMTNNPKHREPIIVSSSMNSNLTQAQNFKPNLQQRILTTNNLKYLPSKTLKLSKS
jgi:hypothetical protein